jgi:hypothetical protein
MSRLASEYALEHMNLTKSLKAEKNRRALGRLRQIFDAVEADRDRMFRASVKLHAQFGRDIREAREDANTEGWNAALALLEQTFNEALRKQPPSGALVSSDGKDWLRAQLQNLRRSA